MMPLRAKTRFRWHLVHGRVSGCLRAADHSNRAGFVRSGSLLSDALTLVGPAIAQRVAS